MELTLTPEEQKQLSTIAAEMGMTPEEYLVWQIKEAHQALLDS